MKKFLKRLAIWTSIVIAALLILAVVIASVFKKPIGNRLIKEINKQLKSELVTEDFDLSLISGFPNVSAEFANVELGDAFGGTLLKAEKLAFRFGLFSLFSSSIKVKTIVVEGGEINIINADRKGQPNYLILKEPEEETPKETEEEPGEFGLEIENAILQNVWLVYTDKKAGQLFDVFVEDGEVSGNLGSTGIAIKSEARIKTKTVEVEGTRYLRNKNLYYDADVIIDLAKGAYKFNDLIFGVGTNIFRASGSVEQLPAYTDIDLRIKNKDGNLGAVIDLLPAQYTKQLEGFRSTGQFHFDATVKGRLDSRKMPAINANFGLKNGRITADLLGTPLRDVSFEVDYTNGKELSSRTSLFEIKNFKAYFDNELFEMGLLVNNFDDPRIDFRLDGAIPLATVYDLLGNPRISEGDGEVELRNIRVKGKYNDMINMNRISNVEANGAIEFDDATLVINDQKVLIDRGKVQVQNNNLAIDDLKFEAPGTEITFNGDCSNLIPVLFAGEKRRDKVELRFNATLNAPQLDIDNLLALSEIPVNGGQTSEAVVDSLKVKRTQTREKVTKFLKGTFKADIANYNYNLIEGKDFKGSLTFNNNTLSIEGNTKAMGGNINLDGQAHFTDRPYLKTKIYCESLDITELFRQTENFGQSVLVENNLNGKLASNTIIYAFWDNEGNFLMDDLNILSDVRVDNGELRDFEMLYNFASVIKLKDLEKIKFVTLQNWLEIKDGSLYIPVMFIQSNALNLTINGSHTFENNIDYNLKVNAGQVIANKLKSHDPTLEPLAAKRNGWFNLYYNISGDLENYEVKSARKEIKQAFANSGRRKEQIKEILFNEFGPSVNLEEPVGWKDEIPEFEGEGDIEEIEYIEGFEEDE